MDEQIDQQIRDLFSTGIETYAGLTWETMRAKIAEPDSHIASRLNHLQISGKLQPVVIYVPMEKLNAD